MAKTASTPIVPANPANPTIIRGRTRLRNSEQIPHSASGLIPKRMPRMRLASWCTNSVVITIAKVVISVYSTQSHQTWFLDTLSHSTRLIIFLSNKRRHNKYVKKIILFYRELPKLLPSRQAQRVQRLIPPGDKYYTAVAAGHRH